MAQSLDLHPSLRSSPKALAKHYLSTTNARLVSPNRFFDEAYYRRNNPDVAAEIAAGNVASGLVHFVAHGLQEGRTPNRDMLKAGPDAPPLSELSEAEATYLKSFTQYFPQADLDMLAARYRVVVTVSASDHPSFWGLISLCFDHNHYISQKPELAGTTRAEAISDYFNAGMRAGLSPVPYFDEAFYLAFYDDIRQAVADNQALCGFEHYLRSGQRENRLAFHDLRKTIETRAKGLSQPTAINRVNELEEKIRGATVRPRAGNDEVIHIVLPDLNPDIEFAGFKSIVELIKELRRRDKTVQIVKTNSNSEGLHYFLYHSRNEPETMALMGSIKAVPASAPIHVGRKDKVIAYSTWDAYCAHAMAKYTDVKKFGFWIQEYEPIFYDFNSTRLISDQAYCLPHFAIFNSEMLRDYFQANHLGVFAGSTSATTSDQISFEHVIRPPAKVAFTERPERNFFLYARPESHAGRNLFEICVLALRRYLAENPLSHDWNFFGLGALTPLHQIALSRDHVLTIRNRLPLEEYQRMIETVDVGMSLMYAPHPSVVPFELLANGALVVTNTYQNRSHERLSAVSPNLIPVDLDLDSIAKGIGVAIDRASDLAARKAGLYHPKSVSWPETMAKVVDQLEARGLVS